MMINETLSDDIEHSGIGSVIMDMQTSLLNAINSSKELEASMVLQLEIMKAFEFLRVLLSRCPRNWDQLNLKF